MSFNKAFNKTMVHEGGYANVSGDNGGETYMGIARKFHPNWSGWIIVDMEKRIRNGKLPRNYFIKNSELDNLVREFYFKKFWQRAWLDHVNDEALQEIIFDFYVNSGATAIRKVQQVLVYQFNKKIRIDGTMGGNTVTAINDSEAKKLFEAIKKTRLEFYKELAKKGQNSKFLRGWLKRLSAFNYKVVGLSLLGGILLIAGVFFAKHLIDKKKAEIKVQLESQLEAQFHKNIKILNR